MKKIVACKNCMHIRKKTIIALKEDFECNHPECFTVEDKTDPYEGAYQVLVRRTGYDYRELNKSNNCNLFEEKRYLH